MTAANVFIRSLIFTSNWIAIFTVAFLSSGCSSTPKSKIYLDPNQVFDKLEKTLAQSPKEDYLNFYDLESENKQNRVKGKRYIQKRQCLYDDPNPQIMVAALSRPWILSLKGKITENGSFQVAVNPSIKGKISNSTEQGLDIPFYLVSLDDLPYFFLERNIKSTKTLMSLPGISNTYQKTLRKSLLNDYKNLTSAVRKLEKNYTKSQCSK